MDAIKGALDGAREYVSTHPNEDSYTDSAATAHADSSLRIRVTGASGEEIDTDFPTSVGGSGAAPSPGWYLRAAEASCVAALVVMRAAQVGLPSIQVQVTVDSISDDRGILGLDDAVPAGPQRSRVVLRFPGGAGNHEGLDAIARWAVEHCPVADALRRAVPMDIEVEVT